MYQQFTETTIAQTIDICRSIISRAKQKKYDSWECTIEVYSGLIEHLERNSSLSPKQCGIIKKGCRFNGLPFPQDLQDHIDGKLGQTQSPRVPRRAPIFEDDTQEPAFGGVTHRKQVTITKEDLDTVCAALGQQVSDAAWEILRNKSTSVH